MTLLFLFKRGFGIRNHVISLFLSIISIFKNILFHPQFCWMECRYQSRPRRGRTMLNTCGVTEGNGTCGMSGHTVSSSKRANSCYGSPSSRTMLPAIRIPTVKHNWTSSTPLRRQHSSNRTADEPIFVKDYMQMSPTTSLEGKLSIH